MEKNCIPFYVGKENAPYLEKNILEAPLFREQYKYILNRIETYVKDSDDYSNADSHIQDLVTHPSNIIAIDGDRGAGKTSVMLSTIEYLSNFGEKYPKKTFFRLDVIDPSFFSNNSNPLQVLIAQLYKKFKKHLDDIHYAIEDRNRVVILFEKIQKCLELMQINFSSDCYAEIDDLEYLAASVDIGNYVEELIQKLLNLFGYKMLLIPIDDIDLNTKYAYEMMEQLRKYFTCPNVLILFAINMKQMQSVLLRHFAVDLNVSKEYVATQDILQMSERYLMKLIPLKNRISLYDFGVNMEQYVEVYRGGDILYKGVYKKLVLDLIYSKTQYLFLNTKDINNYIIPHNLRELNMLLSLLTDMPDVDGDNAILLNNQLKFKTYFYSTWVNIHLDRVHKDFIDSLNQITDFSAYNKTVVSKLCTSYLDRDDSYRYRYWTPGNNNQNKIENLIYRICESTNYNYNISLGDVLALCSYIESQVTTTQILLLLFAIRVHYTFLLQDSYQEQISDSEIQRYYDCVMNGDFMYSSKYKMILAGSAINSEFNAFLPSPKGSDFNRLYHNSKISASSIKQADSFAGALFDLLSCQYRWESKKNSGELAYRKRTQKYYNGDFSKIQEFGCDFFAWTYNLPYIFEGLNRFGFTAEDDFAQKVLHWVINNTDHDEQKLTPMILRLWFQKTCVVSVDYIDNLIYNLTNKSYSKGQQLLYPTLFKYIDLECELKEMKADVAFVGGCKLIAQLGQSTSFKSIFLEPHNKTSNKRQNVRCPLKGGLYTDLYVDMKSIYRYVIEQNPNIPQATRDEIRQLLSQDDMLLFIRNKQWRDISDRIKKIKYYKEE